jgi:aspartate/methionine/tyrosine aminotransferase
MARLGTRFPFEVLARARVIEEAGGKIIHLEIGEPDFPNGRAEPGPVYRARSEVRRMQTDERLEVDHSEERHDARAPACPIPG